MEQAREALASFIRPRDEVALIRKVLAAHLDSCLQCPSGSKPLALVEPAGNVTLTPEVRGLQREYLRALNANAKARQDYEAARARESETTHKVATTDPSSSSVGSLEDHVLSLKLQKKQRRLQAVAKYLELLNQMPAAAPDFLDPVHVFRDSPALPDVPKDAVRSFVLDKTLSQASLDELLDRLQKIVLRSKLLLRREEQLLNEAKRRSSVASSSHSSASRRDGAKLEALKATRNELISWMETELGKASESGETGEPPNRAAQMVEHRAHLENQLSSIKSKYDEYLGARKSLLQLVSQKRQPTLKPPLELSASKTESLGLVPPAPAVQIHLQSPYLERLLALSHEQKGLILQKSHFNVSLAKQAQDGCQALDRIADESHLLPKYPMPGQQSRQQSGRFPHKDGGLSSASARDYLSVPSRAQRWVFAAESAKLATLEAVAVKTEDGELALEGSTRHLSEIDRLLGRQQSAAPEGEAGEESSDIWLSQNQGHQPSLTRQRAESKTKLGGGQRPEDIWAILEGDLGLIRDEGLR